MASAFGALAAFAGAPVFAALAALSALVALVALSAGCRRDAPSVGASVALPEITDQTAGFRFTWVDERGDFHVEEKVADVPPGSRDVVRVADTSKEDPPDTIFLADLRNAGPDGKYAVRAATRDELDKIVVARRAKHGAVLADTPPSAGSPLGSSAAGAAAGGIPPGSAAADVIIYGASWCGPCHQAAAYLKQRGVAFVEKDIEADRAAAREMQAKLAKAGMAGGSIPVLDVRGRVLVGFDRGAVDRALARPL